MVIYWVDTKVPLTFKERQQLLHDGELLSFGPCEILIYCQRTGRKAAVRLWAAKAAMSG